MRLGRDLDRGMLSYNLPLLHFADFIAALPRSATTTDHFICLLLYVERGYNLYSEVRSGGWSREERFGGGGNGQKKVFYIFF